MHENRTFHSGGNYAWRPDGKEIRLIKRDERGRGREMDPAVAASKQKSDFSRGITVMNLPVISCVAEFFKKEKEIALLLV